MGKAWVKDRKRDPYYRKAKAEGYRSRAAYKLLQIQDRFHVIHPGDTVIDLGAAPGGWSQVAHELGASTVVAVDQEPMTPLEGVTFVQADLGDEAELASLAKRAGGFADVVLSDMAPRLSGNRSLDHARSMDLADRSLRVAHQVLREGGHLVTKVFQGDLYPAFRRRVRDAFARSKDFSPPASPRGSAELYLVARGRRGPGAAVGTFNTRA
ncbi:MAG: RlmE family RNA methyltransferase [Thermoplasmata archaeon]